MTKGRELRDQSIEELEAACIDQRKLLFKLTNEQRQSRQFEKPHRIREAKKEIARLLTIINEKQTAKGKV